MSSAAFLVLGRMSGRWGHQHLLALVPSPASWADSSGQWGNKVLSVWSLEEGAAAAASVDREWQAPCCPRAWSDCGLGEEARIGQGDGSSLKKILVTPVPCVTGPAASMAPREGSVPLSRPWLFSQVSGSQEQWPWHDAPRAVARLPRLEPAPPLSVPASNSVP